MINYNVNLPCPHLGYGSLPECEVRLHKRVKTGIVVFFFLKNYPIQSDVLTEATTTFFLPSVFRPYSVLSSSINGFEDTSYH